MATNANIRKNINYAAALAVALVVVWYAGNVFLIAFAAVLLGIFLNALGEWTHRMTKLPYPVALILSILVSLLLLFIIFWLYTPKIVDQFELLMNQLPGAYESLRKTIAPYLGGAFGQGDFSQNLLGTGRIWTQLSKVFSATITSLVTFVIFVFVGVYLAFAPEKYLSWFLLMFPPEQRERIYRIVQSVGKSLKRWIAGKLVSMIVIGLLTFIGLWALDVSLAFILGVIAALFTFIPYVGPILAGIPAVLVGYAQSPITALYVLILYCAVQVIEGYFITPYVEQKTVLILPALAIMTQILMAYLSGGLGLALATPLTVLALALVQESYEHNHHVK